MDQFIIKAMIEALKPALKNPKRAEQILDLFWRDKIALIWSLRDVHTAANEREVALTNQEAVKVLRDLHHRHDKQFGLKWEDLTDYIEGFCLGRKLTKVELRRFVEKNKLTINRHKHK